MQTKTDRPNENGADPKVRTYVHPGQRVRVIAPYSEVMMHMRLAGKPVDVELDTIHGYHHAKVYFGDLGSYATVLSGEAGFHQDDQGWYTYADSGPGDPDPAQVQRDLTRQIESALPGPGTTVITNLGLG